MSGGPLWFIGLRTQGTGFEVEDRRLVGIAFYQTEDRRIICQGTVSIYEKLLPKIAQLE
jgi:hypothetical protein